MVSEASKDKEEMHGGNEHRFGIIPPIAQRRSQLVISADSLQLKERQEAPGGSKHAGIEVKVLRRANHGFFFPMSQFTYM